MHRSAAVEPITVASSAGFQVNDADQVKRQTRVAPLPRSMTSLEDRTMRLRYHARYRVIA
jgi:hypothetical protein